VTPSLNPGSTKKALIRGDRRPHGAMALESGPPLTISCKSAAKVGR